MSQSKLMGRLAKAKTDYEPSGPSGHSLSQFH